MAAEYEKPEFPETHIVTDPDNSMIIPVEGMLSRQGQLNKAFMVEGSSSKA